MKSFQPLFLLFLCAAMTAGCSSVMLKPADFSWPIEVVTKVDGKGVVQDTRYSFTMNVKELLFDETQDSVNVTRHSLRVIRDMRGYYFITADKFKNVYVFEQSDGALKLANKIKVSEKGLDSPAFNQRAPYVQIISENEKSVMVSRDGVHQGGK